MLDEHVTPVGLPPGLTDMEKQMWLAIYSAARKLLALGECLTAEEATKQVTADWGKSKGRDSREFIFALRWAKSVNHVISMKQDFRFCAPTALALPSPPRTPTNASTAPRPRLGPCPPAGAAPSGDGFYHEAGHS